MVHEKVVERVLFVTWHGLGDNVMLTPALRKYKQLHPDSYIGVAGLERFGNTLVQLLSGLSFVDEVIPCLPDAWNDFQDYKTGINNVLQRAQTVGKEKGFSKVIVLPTNRQEGYRLHKIFRFADEVGVQLSYLEDLQTELAVTKEAEKQVEQFIEEHCKPILILHTKAGNQIKTLPAKYVEQLIDNYNGYTILEFGKCSTSKSILVPETDMEFSKALIQKADMVIAIDSVVMHIAGAFQRPLLAIFTVTPVHQAVPLTYHVEVNGNNNVNTALAQWTIYQQQIMELFPSKEKTDINRKDILEFIKNCYSPVPFKGYNANAIRDKGSYKRWHAISQLLPTNKRFKILDIGCNLGFFSFSAAKAGYTVTGIDIDEKCIHYAKRIAEVENVANVRFYHLKENILDYLKNIPDNSFDFIFYPSVHHHIYEQFNGEIANQVLWEISRISNKMLFDMGQPDEKDNGWMRWLKLIPQFHNPKKDIITHVVSCSQFEYGEVISSTKIHGTERWFFYFSRSAPPQLTQKTLQFGNVDYTVEKYIWRTEGSRGILKSSTTAFPSFDREAETKVRYYQVRNQTGEKFFVKEILYNFWLDVTPEEAALIEYKRGRKLYAEKSIAPYIAAPIAINKTLLLFNFYEWPSLINYEKNAIPSYVGHKILQVANDIRNTIGQFDLNANNILYDHNNKQFKFIDFGYGHCDWNQRIKIILNYFKSEEDYLSHDLCSVFQSNQQLFSKQIKIPIAPEQKETYMKKYNEIIAMAEQLAKNDKKEKAILAYKQAIEIAPEQVSAYYNLALLYHSCNNAENAIANFKKAAHLAPGDATIFNNLGVLHYSIDKPDEAETYFKKAIEIKPDYIDAINGLNKVYQKYIQKVRERGKTKVDLNKTSNESFLKAEKHETLSGLCSSGFRKLKLPELYHDPICYWAHMITLRCNGGCPFCILNGRGDCQKTIELSAREILDFWNNIEHKQGQRLSLIGGEPTLHKDIVEIVNNLEGYSLTITTNCKGPFYENSNFYKRFNPHPTSTLRINTTFHPHHISAEEYIRVINLYRKTGYFVDQTSYVYRPDIDRYREAIDKVSKEIPIKAAPYLGFYDPENQFQSPFSVERLEPNENYYDPKAVATMCGLTNFDAYRDMCGQYEKRQVSCEHPSRSLIIGPEGNYYHCHYKMYYGIDPVCNIKDFTPVSVDSKDCRHYGFCNWCDVPRVGCKKNPTAKKLVLNKLYDKREFNRSEIQYLVKDISSFAKQHQLEYNILKWFEYSYVLLYSGLRHRGKVLDVGSAKSIFPYYLASKDYAVTTFDLTDAEYRTETGHKFNVTSVTGDLQEFHPQLEEKFDFISNLSVIEHIPDDTKAVLNLARYLKRGGIMVISTDFFETYIEYPNANRTIVRDRPQGSHTDSRVYTEDTFLNRIISPLEKAGLKRMGATNYKNVDISNPSERSVRGLYTFGIACLRKPV